MDMTVKTLEDIQGMVRGWDRRQSAKVQAVYQRLLACLVVHAHNLRVLHWNVTGVDFDPVHELIGDYYSQLSDFIDEVAEMGLQADIPPVGIVEALEVCGNVLSGDSTYSSEECFKIVGILFNELLQAYQAACEMPIHDDIINKLQEHQQWIRKQLQYKNRQRLQQE